MLNDHDGWPSEYIIRRKVFTFLGNKFHVYNMDGGLLLYTKQKAFKLKEDIRVFTDESMSHERLLIKARHAIDFSASYDVVDSESLRKIGALRRKGFKSLFRDSWELLDENDDVIAKLAEDSMLMATIRRFLSNLIPQAFHVEIDGQQAAVFKQFFNPFVYKLHVKLTPYGKGVLDPRLALAGGILITVIEGRQN